MNNEEINSYNNYYVANNNGLGRRGLIIKFVVLLVVVVAGLVTDHVLTGGATYIKLSSAPPLLGQATQVQVNKVNNLEKSTGYTMQDIHYFDSNTWAITKLVPAKGAGDHTTVVMEKIGQFYRVILGPGTSFPNNVVQGLPPAVSNYLNSNGAVYNTNDTY